MNKQIGRMERIVHIIYPVLIYLVVSEFASLLLQISGLDPVIRQGICSACGFLVLLWDRHAKYKKELLAGVACKKERVNIQTIATGSILSFVLLSFAGIAMNNLISMTSLKQTSSGYQTVEQAFYSSTMFWEILILCLLVPIVEEILYRFFVYDAIALWLGDWFAIGLSALLFALFHGNVVQFVYALVLGVCLGLLRANYRSIFVPIIGHICANLISILRGTTKLFAFFSSESSINIHVTVILTVLSFVIAVYLGIRLYRMGLKYDRRRKDIDSKK